MITQLSFSNSHATVAANSADPTFSAIAKHSAAVDAFYRLTEATPGSNVLILAAMERCGAALWDLLTVKPTTLAGTGALIDHVREYASLAFLRRLP
jgi:hypothetical protein